MAIKHTFTSGKTDGGDGTLVQPSNWNANHTIDAATITYAQIQNVSATDKLLGRSTAGAGSIEEITLTAAGRALIDDADATAQRTTLGLGTMATASHTIASSAPASPLSGDCWIDSDTGIEYTYINDGTSSQWVQTVGSSVSIGGSSSITSFVSVAKWGTD